MKNRRIGLILVMLILPILLPMNVKSEPNQEQVVLINPNSVGIIAGDIIRYTINDLSLPIPPDANITFSDMAGNNLFVKVMAVEEDYLYPDSSFGDMITYAFGIEFLESEVMTLGEGFLALDVIIPTGSATPSIVMSGVPHFNYTYGFQSSLFFVNDDWTYHGNILESLGCTITDTATELKADYIDGSGVFSATWRKSDGVCTALLIDDIILGVLDFTDYLIDLTLESKAHNGLDLVVGQTIELKANRSAVDFSLEDEFTALINQTELSVIDESVDSLVDQTVAKIVVEEIEGMYFLASLYLYNTQTEVLEKVSDSYLFNAFLGSVQIYEPPLMDVNVEYVEAIFSFAITPEWEIYQGQTKLYDVLQNVYADDIINLLGADPDVSYNNIGGKFGLSKEDDYYFIEHDLQLEIEQELILLPLKNQMQTNEVYETGAIYDLNYQMIYGYADNGILAGIAFKGNGSLEMYDNSGTITNPLGKITIDFEFVFENPNYDFADYIYDTPPQTTVEISAFGWLLAIPTLAIVLIVPFIVRRRRRV